MTDFLKSLSFVYFVVTACITVFFLLVELCLWFGVSPWVAGAGSLALYVVWMRRECRRAGG